MSRTRRALAAAPPPTSISPVDSDGLVCIVWRGRSRSFSCPSFSAARKALGLAGCEWAPLPLVGFPVALEACLVSSDVSLAPGQGWEVRLVVRTQLRYPSPADLLED